MTGTIKEETMPSHETGTREERLAARLELLEAEKAHTRRGDELAQYRRELPWVRIDKQYRFDTDDGPASLAGPGLAPAAPSSPARRCAGYTNCCLPRRGRWR